MTEERTKTSLPRPETAQPQDEGEEDDMPMPMPAKVKKRKTLRNEQNYLNQLPNASMYEKSYMHRAIVTHVLVTPCTQFLITASKDGHVKFWKKMPDGVEFVKHYKAHMGPIASLVCSEDGLRLCSAGSEDCHLKFYDVLGFDMVHMISLDYRPHLCQWLHHRRLAVTEYQSPVVRLYDSAAATNVPLSIFSKIHHSPIVVMAFHSAFQCMISSDTKGMIEYWNVESGSTDDVHVTAGLEFTFKLDTGLYDLVKFKTQATSIAVSPDGSAFALTAQDKHVRVFDFASGKLRRKYDESLAVFEDAQAEGTLKLDALDFGRRVAMEKELDASACHSETTTVTPASNVTFDASGKFILFPTLLGIKIINVVTNELKVVCGRVENTERFLAVALFQGESVSDSQYTGGSTASKKIKFMSDSIPSTGANRDNPTSTSSDPTLFCLAFKRHRFYCFSRREPLEQEDGDDDETLGRDVLNEKPTREELLENADSKQVQLGHLAVLHTTMGDIFMKLYAEECPRTVENFCTHARNGYYDKTIFHRVIKNFMVQAGDPEGDGTGGESIWGGEFEDEFHRNLRHDRPFTVSMANAGPGTNGSQFFITTGTCVVRFDMWFDCLTGTKSSIVPTPWLDNKHTVFGRVEKSMDTVSAIEAVAVDKFDKPLDDISIINIDIM